MRTCAIQYVHHVSHSKCTHRIQGHILQGRGEGGGVLQTWMWVLPELCSCIQTQKHYLATRANAQQLERKELDMAVMGQVMGQVMAFTFCSQVPHNTTKYRHQVKERERNESAFYHNGLRVCKRTFLFLHDTGDSCLKAIRAQYITEGLVPRVHGHTGRVEPNALVLDEVKGICDAVRRDQCHPVTGPHPRIQTG